MAGSKNQGNLVPVYGSEDGYLAVKALEDKSLDGYLSTYGARIDGYKVEPGDKFSNVTMKICFSDQVSDANASMWAWFICRAAHPTAQKPRSRVQMAPGMIVVYMTWPIWNQVKYMESSRKAADNF